VRVSLSTHGVVAAERGLQAMGLRARDARPALRMVMAELRADEAARFKSGRGWRRLDPDTVARKRRMGLPAGRLIGEGKLEQSLTRAKGPDAIRELGPTSLRFGTRVAYARYHQSGKGGVPKRRLVAVSREARTRTRRHLRDYIVGDTRGRAR
jgi:hypothetical protein